MKYHSPHSFHIPVMGLAYTIDTPIRVAHYGIDSVVSIVDDELAEKMNAYYCGKFDLPYQEITAKMPDARAMRITSYLNLVDIIVKKKYEWYRKLISTDSTEQERYISMLPKGSPIARQLIQMSGNATPQQIETYIKNTVLPGSIDVNIMTKVDKTNYLKKKPLPAIYNDAHSALRGFANSTLQASVVLSAGMNPSLYGYIAEFPDFFPDADGVIKKKIILKVSDFRSALVQGSFLAKKGLWVSEYRIESGLNCGGHAFATDGLLLGPVMEEFKSRKEELLAEMQRLFAIALSIKGNTIPCDVMPVKITVQGGVGTAAEHDFLLSNYNVDSVGWGSPFLLVPEATSTDPETRQLLANAQEDDFYLSSISPLGIPFNTVKGTSNEYLKSKRIAENKAGSSCPKKLLALNTEFGKEGICTASRKYQEIKLEALEEQKNEIAPHVFDKMKAEITAKSCLCVGLANASYIENNLKIKGEQQGVVICPGPNMAYFDKEVSLFRMLRHIYGYESILATGYRPHMFVKELELYINYFRKMVLELESPTPILIKKWRTFKENLSSGIQYYEDLFASQPFSSAAKREFLGLLQYYREDLGAITMPDQDMVNL